MTIQGFNFFSPSNKLFVSLVLLLQKKDDMMRAALLLSCSMLWLFSAFSQGKLALGQWRSHLPYVVGQYVTQSDSKIYYSTGGAIVAFDKEEMSTEFISKVEGLSNTGIRMIKYNRLSDILIVVYNNSVIHLIKADEIVTLNQIRNFKGIVGEKIVYDIFVQNDSIVYLAANYGISKLNIKANQFVFTTFTGVDVTGVSLFEGNLYAATADGLYRVAENNANITDITTWAWLGQDQGFPIDYEASAIANFGGDLYLGVNDTLCRWKNNQLEKIYFERGLKLQFFSAEGQNLLIGYRCSFSCNRGKVLYLKPDGTLGTTATNCVDFPNFAVQDQKGRVWFGDANRNFRMVNQITDEFCTNLNLNSPYSEFSREITIHNDQVWLASGSVNQVFSYRFLDHGFASLIDGQWTIYNRFTRDELKGEDKNDINDDLLDFITIAIHPDNGKVYAGSFFEGLIEYDGQTMTLYNEKNASLNNAIGDIQRTRISGLAFDEENNLWIANHAADRPISVLKNDGTWQSFKPSCNQTELHQLTIDQNGYKWFVTSNSNSGVVLFDEGDIENPADDRCRIFTENNSNLPTNTANCLAADLDGDVWVGTAEGVIIFECGSNAFEEPCIGTRRVVELDDFGAYLLSTLEITSIAVDGANRKWVGTKSGAFLLSPSGEEQIAHFTAENSPLLDNVINDIAINAKTGEVFISTDKGVVSYQSDAVEGNNLNQSTVEVFPNPVRPEYQGSIAIKGLARDANVKITDVTGKLVYEPQALGGQAIWDGNDYNGKRAQSGVYLVFSTSNARYVGFGKPDAAVAKIVIIN